MGRASMHIAAPPERVWSVLEDPACYPRWVVGAKDLRGSDANFPAPGTRFDHRVGWGPLTVPDHTEVLDAQPPYRLELRARARPLGTAYVTLLLAPRGQGTTVTLIEQAADPLSRLVWHPLTDVLVRGRNAESLRRLKSIAEEVRPAGRAARRPRAGARRS